MASARPPGHDGPDLETYVETRLNLMQNLIDKLEQSLRERIDAVEKTGTVAQVSMDRTSDKVEVAQKEHNLASNNWRAEYNSLKSETAPLTELRRMEREFAAYRLEVTTLFAGQAGASSNAKESRETSMSHMGLVAAAISALVAVAGLLIAFAVFRAGAP